MKSKVRGRRGRDFDPVACSIKLERAAKLPASPGSTVDRTVVVMSGDVFQNLPLPLALVKRPVCHHAMIRIDGTDSFHAEDRGKYCEYREPIFLGL